MSLKIKKKLIDAFVHGDLVYIREYLLAYPDFKTNLISGLYFSLAHQSPHFGNSEYSFERYKRELDQKSSSIMALLEEFGFDVHKYNYMLHIAVGLQIHDVLTEGSVENEGFDIRLEGINYLLEKGYFPNYILKDGPILETPLDMTFDHPTLFKPIETLLRKHGAKTHKELLEEHPNAPIYPSIGEAGEKKPPAIS